MYRHKSPCAANKNMTVGKMTAENQPTIAKTNVIN